MSTKPDFSIFLHGSTWVRADLHLHTKADKEFKYAGNANYYNSAYVDALEKAGIRLGVITNHNKFDLEEYKALRTTARKKEISLLPGVELSVNDGYAGVHVLVIFSDRWIEGGNDRVNPFLASMFPGKTPQEYEHENGRSDKTLLQVVEALDQLSLDYFLVFAHVEDAKGLWAEVGMGKLGDWKQPRYDSLRFRTLGFQKVRSYNKTEKADEPCRTKAVLALGDWYPAEVEGSDPKSVEQIGKGQSCYIKLGELTFEALKFALSDYRDRVASELPNHKTSHIRSIQFEGGVLDGKTLCFSPELNALIGIRGSGKSSVLEAIRYVLDIPRGEKALDTKYKDELIKHTLGSGGKATVVARDVYGQEFSVSRIFRESPNVYLGGKLQPGVSIRETVLRQPIYFGQKDLSSTGDGFETDLVEKLVGEKLRPLRSKIEARRQLVREAVTRYHKLQNTAEQKREYETQLADATFRLKKFAEFGLAEKLQKRIGFQQDTNVLTRVRNQVETFIDGLESFIAEHEDDLKNAPAYFASEANIVFFAEYFAEYAPLIVEFEKLKAVSAASRKISSKLGAKKVEFDRRREGLQEEFAQIERQLAEELKQTGTTAIQPDDFLQQQQRKTKAEQMLELLTKQEKQKDTVFQALIMEINALNELWLEEFRSIKVELDRVNANHTALNIEAEFKGGRETALIFMQQMYRGSSIREATLRNVMTDYADFGGLFRDLENAKSKAGSTPDVFEKTLLQNLPDFLTYQVPNSFLIRYRGKELKHHSLGQRSSALILYVLSQRENDVIIIDQPEDDLDNQTIYDDVIKLIREMKPATQFIFATHNANFPVLGDAEQVHACRYQDDEIQVQTGSIDAKAIQTEIINIMEGGEEAFNKRKEVYSQWKPQNSSK
jgi:ABC-type cobalamin/Fe3+-siderophores transport system ATPase subunit